MAIPNDKTFHCVKRRVLDKDAVLIVSAPFPDAAIDLEAAELPIKAGTQVGLFPTAAADLALIEAAADGVLFEVDVSFYVLKVVATGVALGNILYRVQSTIDVRKVDGHVYWNNANVGHINPNAMVVEDVTDNVSISELPLAFFN